MTLLNYTLPTHQQIFPSSPPSPYKRPWQLWWFSRKLLNAWSYLVSILPMYMDTWKSFRKAVETVVVIRAAGDDRRSKRNRSRNIVDYWDDNHERDPVTLLSGSLLPPRETRGAPVVLLQSGVRLRTSPSSSAPKAKSEVHIH